MSDSSSTIDSSKSSGTDSGFVFNSIIQNNEMVQNFFHGSDSTIPYYISNKKQRKIISDKIFEKINERNKKGQRIVKIFNPPGFSCFLT